MRFGPIGALALAAAIGCSDGEALPPGDTPDMGASDLGEVDPPDLGTPDAGGEVVLAPSLDRVRPTSGSVEGGDFVTLRGTNFEAPARVFFGEFEATQVTLLDAFAVEVLSPAQAEGVVDVRIEMPNGEAVLEDAFTYTPVFEITDVQPERLPAEGGVEVRIIGRGFTPETLALIDRTPLAAAEVLSNTEIVGLAPATEPGRPEVKAVNRRSIAERLDLLVTYPTPRVDEVAPRRGIASGGELVAVSGSGLDAVTSVRLGGAEVVIASASPNRLEFETPALPEGAAALELITPDEVVVSPGAYVIVGTGAPGLSGAAPFLAVRGQTLLVAGRGLAADATVRIAGVGVLVRDAEPDGLLVELDPSIPLGSADVEVDSGGQTFTLDDAVEVLPVLRIDAVSPEFAAVDQPLELTLVGEGLSAVTEVRLDDILLSNVDVVNDGVLTAQIPGGRHGPVDVRVRSLGGQEASLPAAFAFEEPFEFLQIDPSDGANAGGTLVTAYGRGFEPPIAVSFGGGPSLDTEIENGSVAAARTPQALSGSVDVVLEIGTEAVNLPSGYAYFNPRSLVGGGFGGPIRGDVNVSVVGFDGNPVGGATVQLGYDADPNFRASTNADGIAVVSTRYLRGPVTVTGGQNGREFTTFVDINTRNLTALVGQNPAPPPEDQPLGLCPDPVMPPIIRGQVFGLKSELDLDENPNIVPVVTVTYSARDALSPNPAMIPGAPPNAPPQVAQVFSEGGEFEIATARQGTVAVFALLEEVNVNNPADRTPRRLGIARSVPVAVDQVTENVIVDMVIDLDQTFQVRLDNPPGQEGQDANAVFPFLNLQSDGVIGFPAQLANGDIANLENMPDLARSEFIYLAGSFTIAGGGLGPPWSLNIQQSEETDEGEDVGPFLVTPRIISPKPADVVEDDQVVFEREGVTPDLTIARFGDSIGFSSCCCQDINANGLCDPAEEANPACSPPIPQPFTRWSFYGPGALQSIEIPDLPSGIDAFERPKFYSFTLQQALAPRFTFDEFEFNAFSPFFWQSWTQVDTGVVIREDTD
ncbi:MAG: IPT/TIG domain-containing protein [Myxococcota bacterium]